MLLFWIVVYLVGFHILDWVLLNTGIHQNIPEYTEIHRNTPKYTGIHVCVYLIINVIMSYMMLDTA